jgi:hypothetical protein
MDPSGRREATALAGNRLDSLTRFFQNSASLIQERIFARVFVVLRSLTIARCSGDLTLAARYAESRSFAAKKFTP